MENFHVLLHFSLLESLSTLTTMHMIFCFFLSKNNSKNTSSISSTATKPKAMPATEQTPSLPTLNQFTVAASEGAEEMARYYSRLYSLERQMRTIIVDTLSKTHGSTWWETCVPQGIQETAKQILQKEERTGVTPRSNRFIDYTTLGELGVIVNSNWSEFTGQFKNQQAMSRIIYPFMVLMGI